MSPGDDDLTIPDDCELYRRVPSHQLQEESEASCTRVSSAVFRTDELSVGLGVVLTELGRDPTTLLDGYAGAHLVAFQASVPRAHGLPIVRDPEDDEPAHGLVLKKKTTASVKAMHRASSWIVSPRDACATPAG